MKGAARRIFLGAILLTGLATPAAAASPPPNILLITVDTLRADHLGCYGDKNAATPVIDALAQQGVVFDQALSQVPLTWPSHVAILTGTYPFYNGVQDFTGQPLREDVRTVAQSLKAHGYATGAVVSSFVLDRSWGLSRGFDSYDDAFSGMEFVQQNLGLVDRKAEGSVDHAIAWLGRRQRLPFFLWLHLYDPHSPYRAPEPYRSRFSTHPYDGEIAYVDAQLGRLFDWLKEKNLYQNTVIVFVSDHGESLGEHGEREHGFFVYNATLHVPLIVKPAAGQALKPRRIDAPVEIMSLAPTLVYLAGVQRDPILQQFQTNNLAPLMAHGQAAPDAAAYSETFYPFSSFGWSPLRSLETARYHYIQAPTPELYDVDADPQEKTNLAARLPGEVAELGKRLQALISRYPPPQRQEETAERSPEELEKLRSLGYVAYRAAPPASSKLSDPKDKVATYEDIMQATDAFDAGDFATGQALLKRVQQSDPDLYLAHFLLGEAYTKQENWPGAVAQFEKALQINPNFDQAMLGLGRALTFLNQRVKAQEWLRKALDFNPNNYRALFELARAQAPDDNAAALASLNQAIALQPNFAIGYRARGVLEVKQGDYKSAVTSLKKALELGLEDPVTYNYLGIGYSRTGQLQQAVQSYQSALALKPDYAEAHLNLGFVYQRLNQPENARQEYQTACRQASRLCPLVPAEYQ